MRDNFLTAVLLLGEDNVDEDALCKDVVDSGGEESPFAGPDALIAWTDPWSPGGWEVTEPFLRKWGWIVRGCVELQEGTNTWRSRRGLPSLRFPGC
ncbi:hypothetical protein F5X68DRAFT_201914 [Plectosphaerella plurivora]|uniref:Uncharacterized protein n=1 Tax=Plectosphaerella plurivora TaxID=936078 RepID=A0A9P8VFD1_9PEZI|nr:hypothetical protein F5X68DRAFT_201914 [Plectosphaerella plurivora]